MKHLAKRYKKGFAVLAFVHKMDRNVIPAYMLEALIDAVYPYIALIFSTLIIDSLLMKHWDQSLQYAIIMIVLQTIVGILLDILKAYNEAVSMTMNRKCGKKLCDAALNLDYESLEEKEVREELAGAEMSVGQNGGFGMLMIHYRSALKDIIAIFISGYFVIMLCLSVGKHVNFSADNWLMQPFGSILFLVTILLIIFYFYQRKARKINQEIFSLFQLNMSTEQEFRYFMNEVFMDYTKAKDIRLYNIKDMLLKQYNKRNRIMQSREYDNLNLQSALTYRASLINDGLNLVVYAFIILKVAAKAITIGEFSKYVGSFQQMNKAINDLITQMSAIRICNSYLSYIVDYSTRENKLSIGTLPIEKRNDHVYEIEFHHVSFKYPKTETEVLKDVNIKLTLKDKLAVVGRNGSGKTTFIKLLCRLYDPSEGYITLNGIDIKKYDYLEYLKLFAVVFQDFSMFAFPIKENIADSEDIDEQKIWDCLEKAGVDEKVAKLPKKLDTSLMKYEEEGVDISGGEAQKLAIARALYKDAPFVILDEPTASLDPISEYEIYSRFNDLVDDKTSIFISHRMSSCRFCDDILVFDNGKVIQRGNHDSLINEKENVYARLWNAQAKYYA